MNKVSYGLESLFTWNGYIFSSSYETSKLRVNWYFPSFKLHNSCQAAESDENPEIIESSDQERETDAVPDLDLDSDSDIFIDQRLGLQHQDKHAREKAKFNKDHEIKGEHWNNSLSGSTEIDLCQYGLGQGTTCTVIENRFSYDPSSLKRVPVLLVLLQNKNVTVSNLSLRGERNILVLFSLVEEEEPIRTIKSSLRNVATSLPILQGQNTSLVQSFKLIFKRKHVLNDFIDDTFYFQNVAFVSNFGFIHVDLETTKLSLYYSNSLKNEETCAEVEHYLCSNDTSRKCPVVSFYIYNYFESNSFLLIALVNDTPSSESESRNKNESESRSCEAIFFSPKDSLLKKFEVKHIQCTGLFPQEFSQIMLSISISLCIISTHSYEISSSSVIMISTTGYLIRFFDGEMIHCIRLTSDIDKFCLQSTSNIGIIIDLDCKSDHKITAISIDGTSDIVDWSKKKVISSYYNVSFMGKYDVMCNGYPFILLLLHPKSNSGVNKQELCVQDLVPVIIDGEEVKTIEDGNKSPEEIPDHSEVTQSVLENLLLQEKKCQSELKECEQGVKNKELFIKNMQKMFSNDLSLKHDLNERNLYLQPLVPLIGESPLQTQGENKSFYPKEVLDFGQLWKRTVDFLLVCGIKVTNVSKAHKLSEMVLSIIPVNSPRSSVSCSSKILYKTDSSSCQFDSSSRKKSCLADQSTPRTFDDITLNFKESISLATYTDISKILGGENLIFKILLTYKLHTVCHSQGKKEPTPQSVCCGQFSLMTNDLILQSYSIKTRFEGNGKDTLTIEDTLALDCIQQSYDLEVKSEMTSVLDLKTRLQVNRQVTYISRTDDFIFNADQILCYSRIKWLNQNSKYKATIKVYTRSESDVILLVQFLYSLVPRDIIITLPINYSQPPISTVKAISQSCIQRVENSVLLLKKQLASMESITTPCTDLRKDESFANDRNNPLNLMVADEDEHQSSEKSPTFQSSVSRQGRTFKANNFPGASTIADAGDAEKNNSMLPPTGKSNFMAMSDGSLMGKDFTTTKEKTKGKSGKGGIRKGKGKFKLK